MRFQEPFNIFKIKHVQYLFFVYDKNNFIYYLLLTCGIQDVFTRISSQYS